MELGQNSPSLRFYQLSLGLAEYRNDQEGAAEKTLTVAEKQFENSDDAEFRGIARLFRAVSLFRQGKREAARKLFSLAQAEMPPFPTDEREPFVDGKPASHDVLLCWLAYKEAKGLIESTAKADDHPE